MKDEEAESKKKIEDAFAAAGLRVPCAPWMVIAGLKVDKSRGQKIVTLIVMETNCWSKFPDELRHFTAATLQQLRRLVAGAESQISGAGCVANFKELTGVSRMYAIPLLEYLDREHVTKRVGDVREIL